jgi:LPS export ABC transporter protein LptC
MPRGWLLLVFAGALAVSLWQMRAREDTGAPTATAATANAEPGYIALDAELIDTGDDGQPQYRLRAQRIEQAQPAADIELTRPEFHYQGTTAWTLTAQRGALPPGAEHVALSGEVNAVGVRAQEPPLRIRTDMLAIDLQGKRLDTSSPVAIDWGRNRLSGTGLHADMKADSLRLESGVHGEFAR